ncbi:MAG: hypothetical protein ACLFWF_04350 [Alphaproteobacteria bacterium]
MPNARIELLDFLDTEECRAVEQTVLRLRDLWELREKPGSDGVVRQSYYTLGVPSYLDAVTHDKEAGYYSKARELNPTLGSEFKGLYDKLKTFLSACLGKPVTFAPGLALPGFHIYPAEPGVQYSAFELHLDLQYKYLHWERPEEIDFANPVSFTVPVTLPDEGGGLNVCELSSPRFMLLNRDRLQSALAEKTRYVPYVRGRMALQWGMLLHGVAKWRNVGSRSPRITLQGHALRRRDSWQVYW